MGFQSVIDLDAETTISIGGFNKKLKKNNPTSVEGYYLGTRQVASAKAKNGLASIHYFQTPKGNIAVWGKTDMDRKVGNLVKGVMVRITFDKMQETPNGEMYKYKVDYDPDNALDIETLPKGASTVQAEDYSNNEETADDTAEELDEETQALLVAEQAKRAAKVQELLNKKK